jgi:hypothetical protein
MKAYFFILIMVIIGIFSCNNTNKRQSYTIKDINLCENVRIETEVLAYENIDTLWQLRDSLGEWKWQQTEAWTEYDMNEINFRRPMPDSIKLNINLIPSMLMDKELIGKDIFLRISYKFQFSDFTDCLNPINPIYTDWEVMSSNKIIKFRTLNRINIQTNSINLKDKMTFYNESNKFLNKIIIKTEYGTENEIMDCFSEYTFNICTSIPLRKYIGEF